MSYEKQTWAAGDTITSERLNHMEGGIEAAGVLMLTFWSEDDGGKEVTNHCDHTWEEVTAAYAGGTPVIARLKLSGKQAGDYEFIGLTVSAYTTESGLINLTASGVIYEEVIIAIVYAVSMTSNLITITTYSK